jgi:hypothetical protein
MKYNVDITSAAMICIGSSVVDRWNAHTDSMVIS